MIDITKLKAMAEAFPDDLDFDSNTTPFFNGPSGESLGGESTGFYCVYGKPFDIDGEMYDGNEYVSTCTREFAEFMCSARGAVLELIAEVERLREDLITFKGTTSALVQALKKVTFCARTTGGTAGPDAGLMEACEAAENVISLVGVSRAIDYVEGLKAENETLRKDADCVDDLSALVRRLVQHLLKAAPDNDLPEKALDYLKRKGLLGSPLRGEEDHG